jgi:hypothetical protein
VLYAGILVSIRQRLLALAGPEAMQVQLLRVVSSEIAALKAKDYPDGLPTFEQITP